MDLDLLEPPLPAAVAPAAPTPAPSTAPARLLDYADGALVALPAHATVALVPRAGVVHVPGTPAHVIGVMPWARGYIPLIDLAVLLGAEPPAVLEGEHVLVLAWQSKPRAPLSHGAVRAPALVRFAEVTDNQQCDCPADSPMLERLAICCLRLEGQVVPVLDTGRLFGAPV